MNIAFKVLIFAVAGYVLLVAAAAVFRNSLIFHPTQRLEATPKSIGLFYEEVNFKAADGVTLRGWFIPALQAGTTGKTLLFFHGNGGNISHRLDSIRIFNRLGLNVFIFDYHGYGQSGGSPSISATEQDALAAWGWLTEEKKVLPKDIIIFGRSLGGGVAGWLAGRLDQGEEPAALILESTFTSLAEAGKDVFPFLPVQIFIGDAYDTKSALQKLNAPVFFAHSPDDKTVSYKLGKKLYESYQGPKYFLELTGGHNDGFLLTGERYVEALKNFLQNLK